MKLKRILGVMPDAVVRGSKEIEITGITSHSRSVAPGDLFIAKKGGAVDGAHFIPDAIAGGAMAILTSMYNPYFPQITQVIHPQIDQIEPWLAKCFFEDPSAHLYLIGITGTNGKTTVSYLVKHLLDAIQGPCGLIGTIEWITGQNTRPATLTTPDVITNQKLFKEMVIHECRSAVMEVSSHALHQNRVIGIDYDRVIFTNLTQDHLDYHENMEAYAAAKATLFHTVPRQKKSPRIAIINADSPWHQRMIQNCQDFVLTYGIESASCDIKAEGLSLHPNEMKFIVNYQGQKCFFRTTLIGRFNVYNCLAAIAVGVTSGVSLSQTVELLSSFSRVPGRLERVVHPKGVPIFVDYAHTDDALKNVLETLREITPKRLIVVFGCGGNRDMLKRPKMGAVVDQSADIPIVTSDNPRHENPHDIIQQVLKGFQDPSRVKAIVDRREAIHAAIGIADPEDVILIAGKGHETYQILSDQTILFDDRQVAAQAPV